MAAIGKKLITSLEHFEAKKQILALRAKLKLLKK